ncbi:MAG: hypothetical protein GX423_03125 [Nitrospiraceae bacterium]|jgi:hypothetical protein|nr:hypothetical protein [Nitrospiraceae bacterium]
MYTLFDYISTVNGIQYVLMIAFIGGFIIFLELLKPRPFAGLMRIAADDIGFVRTQSPETRLRSIKRLCAAPVYALLYIAAIPVLFIHGVAVIFSRVIMALTWVSWSPVRAYFRGSKKTKRTESSDQHRA